jgi:tetratricopeptide (TPR) repeat protein
VGQKYSDDWQASNYLEREDDGRMTTSEGNTADSVDKPLVFYKYRADNENTERLLATRQVWLSTASQLNDPFECSLQEIAAEWIREKVHVSKQAQLLGFSVQLREAIKSGASFFGVPRGQLKAMQQSMFAEGFDSAYRRMRNFIELVAGAPPSDPEQLYSGLDDRLNSVGIFSMSQSPDNELMWAHYGNSHTGICLGFGAAPEGKLADPSHCLRVNYASEVPTVPNEGLQITLAFVMGANGKPRSTTQIAFSDPTFQAAMASKALGWSYEKEWRYVEPLGGTYPWPGPLREITFGLRCPEQRRDHYSALVEASAFGEVEVFEIRKAPNSNVLVRKAMGKILGKGGPLGPGDEEDTVTRVAAGSLIAEKVEQLVRDQDFAQALSIVNSILDKEPNYFPAVYQKGMTLGHMGDHESALAIFQRCCAEAPNDPVCWYQLGVSLHQLGKPEDAIDALRRALSLDPSDASTAFNLGVVLVNQGHIAEGRHNLEAAARNGHPRASLAIESLSGPSPGARRSKVGRNQACPCGSGKKFKKCHGV